MASSSASSPLLFGGVLVLAVGALASPVIVSPPYLFGEEPPTPDVLTESYGYATETHSVESNGYLLTVFRFKGPRKREEYEDQRIETKQEQQMEPFVLQHGLASNAAQWVMFGPEHSLAYTLADEGFDVWMASGRGSKYGKRHRTLQPDTDAFWNFSWHQQGVEDLPAIIDYVINATGYRQVWYAGHSMGTTMMFVMNSERPEYDAKIKHHFALAPTAFLGRVKNQAVLDFTRKMDESVQLWKSLGMTHFSAETPLLYTTRTLLCALMKETCKQTFFYDIFKVDETQGFANQAEITGSYLPGDFSMKQVTHFGQNALEQENFRWFDYGEDMNQEIYNSTSPPQYDMSKVTVPTTFIYAESDDLTVPEDVVAFSKLFLSSRPRMHMVQLKEFNHGDFISAKEQRKYVHEPILGYIKEIRKESGLIPHGTAHHEGQPETIPVLRSTVKQGGSAKGKLPSPNKVSVDDKRSKIDR